MWDEPPGEPPDLDLRILQVAARPLEGPLEGEPAYRILLRTTRGEIGGILHPVEGGTSALVCVGGAMGGLDGPAQRLYARLPAILVEGRVTVLRLDYRRPNDFLECVLDTLAGCSFLQGVGASELALVGHSFGGAVVVRAGQLSALVRGVVALAPQTYGTQDVAQLGKPLLLVHGTADGILSAMASEEIYRRAAEPRRIVLFEDEDHAFSSAGVRLDELLREWLFARFAGLPMESGRTELPRLD